MWGANDHQAADVAVRRDVAHFRKTAWAQEALALHLRVTYAQRRRGGIGEAHREAHDHEVCSGIRGGSAAGSRDGALGWGRNEFEQQILEVTFVHRNTELSCKAYENGGRFATATAHTSRFVAQVATYLHLCSERYYRDSYAVFYAFIQGVMDVSRVAGGQRSEDDYYLARGMCW